LFVLGGIGLSVFFSCQGSRQDRTQEELFVWVIMDDYYVPRNPVEEFIYNDAETKGFLPVSIRNYGKNKKALKSFRGKNFAGPTEAQIKMMFKGLEDWMLLDIKYKDEKEREVLRTVLYIFVEGTWRVGDSGSLSR
jgi:hypothetical protein